MASLLLHYLKSDVYRKVVTVIWILSEDGKNAYGILYSTRRKETGATRYFYNCFDLDCLTVVAKNPLIFRCSQLMPNSLRDAV